MHGDLPSSRLSPNLTLTLTLTPTLALSLTLTLARSGLYQKREVVVEGATLRYLSLKVLT